MHVPGWHEATKRFQEQGKVQLVGIIEEQHPDRAHLFMQWKQMNWPILVDSLDLLNVSAVPISVAIDESGIVRAINPKKETIEETFLGKTYKKATVPSSSGSSTPDFRQLKAEAAERKTAQSWRIFADALVLWGGSTRLTEAIDSYQAALKLEPEDAPTRFHLGVAFRKRYESEATQSDDFQKAVVHWKAALDLNPNQYMRKRAHWNNEVGDLLLWINPPGRWKTERRCFTVANPPQSVSQEVRRIELEVQCPPNASTGEMVISGYVLYYVCEDVHGTCLYRRQDLLFKVTVR